MESLIGVIQAVCVGKSEPFIRTGRYSAISKSSVRNEIAVYYEGLEGDEQADLHVHGGVDKAIHIYPFEHYTEWKDELRGPTTRFMNHGSFGENLSTLGLTEKNICLGDVLSIGSVKLEVNQTRQPCWKVNEKFGIPDLANLMQKTMRTGFYCRVLQPGLLASGHSIELTQRPYPNWPLERLLKLLYINPLDQQELEEVLTIRLVPRWKKLFEQRLSTQTIEDWTRRLSGQVTYERTL